MEKIDGFTKESYSKKWTTESDCFDKQGMYEKLSALIPDGNTLELGCGTGKSTLSLLKNHNVLSLDSNEFLIKKARDYLSGLNHEVNIHNCNFLSLSDRDLEVIKNFSPKIITGWFIGSCGEDTLKFTTEQPDHQLKSKLYREKIEDIIALLANHLNSVEYVNLVSRGQVVVGYNKEDFFKEIKCDNDKYIFLDAGFEVVSVENIPWDNSGSSFPYIMNGNPEVDGKKVTPTVTSVLAKRIVK
ncbi:class I SAM-dependent methyltransferase [Morganella morganii]